MIDLIREICEIKIKFNIKVGVIKHIEFYLI